MDYKPADYHQYELYCKTVQDCWESSDRGAREAHRWAGVLRLVLDAAITEFASIKSKNAQLPRLLEAAKIFADTILNSTAFVRLFPSDDPSEFLPIPILPRNYICVHGNENCPCSANYPDCTPPLTDADCPPPPEEDFCD